MQRLTVPFVACVAAALVWTVSCAAQLADAASDRQAPVEHVLGPDQSVSLPNSSLTLTFEAVDEDSRCPTGTECIWEGNAAVRVRVDEPGRPAASYVLNTSTRFQQTFDHGDVRVRLVKVEPHPAAGAPVPPADYRITVASSRK